MVGRFIKRQFTKYHFNLLEIKVLKIQITVIYNLLERKPEIRDRFTKYHFNLFSLFHYLNHTSTLSLTADEDLIYCY